MTSPEIQAYQTALRQARNAFNESTVRLELIKGEQVRLEEDIARLRKTITALSAMCSEDPGIDKLGITSSVMKVMSETPYSWSTAEVVTALDDMGFDLAAHKNAQASVHAVLTRLFMAGKITRVATPEKGHNGAMEWRGPKYEASSEGDVPF